MTQMGAWEPTGPIGGADRGTPMNLWLAKEFGLHTLADALAAGAEQTCEPNWDTTRGEFTWGFGLDEPHPRGQYNGTMASAQVATEGSWWRLANEGPGSRFAEPTVVDVDFPTVALREARWNPDTATLTITPVAIGNDPHTRTTIRVTNIADPTSWTAHGPLAPDTHLRATGPDLHIDTPVRGEALRLRGRARSRVRLSD